MEIMKQADADGKPAENEQTKPENGAGAAEGKTENIFSDASLPKESVVEGDGPVPEKEIKLLGSKREVRITPEDKAAFIDALVLNSRFTKTYSLFGGNMKVTLRSLTADEVNAIATWSARKGTEDSAGLLAGRYRKFLAAAHVATMDGVEMPPLEEPLYEKLGSDGKTVEPPGWVGRCEYWDGVGFGKFQAVMGCIGDFDALYSALCNKAEDANFWNPDTP